MPPWLALTRAEFLRLRTLSALARRNPLLPLAAAAALVLGAWLSVRAGIATGGLVAGAPPALLPLHTLFLLSAGMLGGGSALLAPRASRHDEQLRLLPLPPSRVFLGTTAVPLTALWVGSLLPFACFVGPFYWQIPVPHRGGWFAVLCAAYLAACVVGASVAEAIRLLWHARANPRQAAFAWVALPMPAALLLVAVVGRRPWWSGTAAWLPGAVGRPFHAESGLLAITAILASGLVAGVVWVLLGGRVVPAARAERIWITLSPRHSGRYVLLGWWLVTAFLRDTPLFLSAILATCGAAVLAFANVFMGREGGLLAPLALLLALAGGGQVAMTLSERLQASGWFWRLAPSPREVPGLWWWVGASALAIAVSTVAVVPAVLRSTVQPADAAVLLAASSFGVSALGRATPWNSRSQLQQAGSTVLYFGGLLGVGGLFDWVGGRVPALMAASLVVLLVAALSAGLCAYLPWRNSWRQA